MANPRRVEAAVAAARSALPALNSLRPMYTSDVVNAIAAALRAYDEREAPVLATPRCPDCGTIPTVTSDATAFCVRCEKWMVRR